LSLGSSRGSAAMSWVMVKISSLGRDVPRRRR
jgi:hypothetical protein